VRVPVCSLLAHHRVRIMGPCVVCSLLACDAGSESGSPLTEGRSSCQTARVTVPLSVPLIQDAVRVTLVISAAVYAA
jgi:hypothetical protein